MHNILTTCRILLLLACCCLALLGAAEQQPCLYVVNSLSDDLSVINTTTGAIAQLPLGARGYHIALSPRHTYALVTATAHAVAGAANKTDYAGLLVVDLAKGSVCGSIPMALSPLAGVHIHPNGKLAYVVTAAGPGNRNSIRGQVLVVDLEHNAIIGTVNIGLNPLDSVMTPDGSKLYTADWGSKSISIVDLASGRLFDSIPLGANPARVLALSPSGDMLFAGFEHAPMAGPHGSVAPGIQQYQAVAPNESMLWAFNTNNGAISRYTVPGVQKVLALAVSPDAGRLYIYARMRNTNGSNIQSVPLGSAGSGTIHVLSTPPAQQSVPQQAQRGNAESDDLLVFDLNAQRVVSRFGGYGGLASMAVSADGKQLYLIGTPGDPAQEAAVRAKVAQRLAQANNQNTNNIESVNVLTSNAGVTGMIDDLSQVHKTVTVLDAATGRKLVVYPVGSLPQGSAWLP